MDFLPWQLTAAYLLDLIFGDPTWAPHPIRWIGVLIGAVEKKLYPKTSHAALHLAAGSVFWMTVMGTVVGAAWLLLRMAGLIHPALASLVAVWLACTTLATRSLHGESSKVAAALCRADLPGARQALSRLVSRETAEMTEEDILRALLETVAENLSDGVVAPLFYLAVGGSVLAMAYKAVSTMDSMVGYRNDVYLQFGKVSARLDDIANFIPARLSVPVIAFAARLLSGSGKRAFHTAVHEGSHHASPNSGYSEAAFAGALSIKLNGPSSYHGKRVNKPFIGIAFGDVTRSDIRKACDLMLLCSFLWTFLLAVISAAR
ncbi:MAG TPA: cobalamin biosynthesis protein CobD [Syntrophobacteraceae bacterium]|nr:cobalamin biosynthesis protein CobD [Syntrophobacteraceae bacterium]